MAYDFVSQFAQKLIEEAGLKALPPDYLDDYQNRLEEQIVKRMGLIAMEKLDDKGLEEYNKMIESTGGDLAKLDQEKVYQLWQERIPDFQKSMMEGLAEFGREFLENIQKQRE